jgi:hypothetical protein
VVRQEDLHVEHALPPQAVAEHLLMISVRADGRTEIKCALPKLEAVKLLAGLLEEFRIEAIKESGRLIAVPRL